MLKAYGAEYCVIALVGPAVLGAADAKRIIQGAQQMLRQVHVISTNSRTSIAGTSGAQLASAADSSVEEQEEEGEHTWLDSDDTDDDDNNGDRVAASIAANKQLGNVAASLVSTDSKAATAPQASQAAVTTAESSSQAIRDKLIPSTSGRPANTSLPQAAFAATWLTQSTRSGLLGALVALSYPDRIAKRQIKGGGSPSYMLNSGVASSIIVLCEHSEPLKGV